MKPVGILLLLATTAASPAQDAEFTAGMKDLAASSSLLEKLEAKNTPAATRAAENMAGIYEEMIGFWRQRSSPDAVKLSVQGKAAAVALASAAHAGDAEKATAAFTTLTGTCKPCHEKYRAELPDGTYRIKPPVEE